jgi:hypothetical protein
VFFLVHAVYPVGADGALVAAATTNTVSGLVVGQDDPQPGGPQAPSAHTPSEPDATRCQIARSRVAAPQPVLLAAPVDPAEASLAQPPVSSSLPTRAEPGLNSQALLCVFRH